jgi:hypothetical protein
MALPLYLGMLPVCSGHWPAWWSPLPGATPLFWAKVCASLASERRQGSPPVELVRYGSCKRKHVCVYHACMAKSLCRPPTKRTYGTIDGPGTRSFTVCFEEPYARNKASPC